MKQTVLILVLAIVMTTGDTLGQAISTSYFYSLTQPGHAGQKFRLTAFIRTDAEDADTHARLWLREDRNNIKGFEIRSANIQSAEWRAYSVEGTFDADYSQIVLGVQAFYNGRIYVDDLHLEVQINARKWSSIYSQGFEDSKTILSQGTGKVNDVTNTLFSGEVTNGFAHGGRNSFVIQGKNVPNFGTNAKAGKYADVNGIKLYYEIYGEGHPLVVLHGNGGSIKAAAPHYPDLIKRYKVIAVDSRAQGKSTDTDAPLTFDMLTKDIADLLDELKIDSAYVWGQSDGAILGLLLAMNHPKKVSKVLAYAANIQPDSNALFPWSIAFMKRMVAQSPSPTERKLNQMMLDYPNIPYEDLSRIRTPVLIMVGDRDIIRPEHTLKMFQHIPKSQLCVLPGATHMGAWAKKDLFMQYLYTFFDSPFTMPDMKNFFR